MSAELDCQAALRAGEIYDGGAAKAHIKGDMLRRLVLESTQIATNKLSGAIGGAPSRLGQTGIRLKNVVIVGGLDLSDCSADDIASELTLDLESCVILPLGSDGPDSTATASSPCLLARHAHFSRLRIHDCRFSYIDITGADLVGDLELTGASGFLIGDFDALDEAADEEQERLWPPTGCKVEARMVELGGMLQLQSSKFSLPTHLELRPDGSKEATLDTRPNKEGGWTYALNFSEAKIGGSVMAQPNVAVDGGLSLVNADVRGDLWGEGLHLSVGGSEFALRLQGASIGGAVILRSTSRPMEGVPYREFVADGGLDFLYAKMSSLTLRLSRITTKSSSSPAIYGGGMRITGHLGLSSAGEKGRGRILGSVNINGAKIDGYLAIDFVSIDGGVSLRGLRLGGQLDVRRTHINGTFDIRNAQLEDDIYIGARTKLYAGRPMGAALVAENVSVRGDAQLFPHCDGNVIFAGANVGGDLQLGSNDNGEHAIRLSPSSSLNLVDANIGRALVVSNQIRVEGIKPFERAPTNESSADITPASPRPEPEEEAPYSDFPRPTTSEVLPLSFYPGGRLVEMLTEDDGIPVVLAAVLITDRATALSGSSAPIHEINRRLAPELGSDLQAADYLKFFSAYVWGEHGPFHIIEHADHFTEGPVREAAREHIEPLQVSRDDSLTVSATVCYAHRLFRAKFQLHRNGGVEMLEDQELVELPGEDPFIYSSPKRYRRNHAPISLPESRLTFADREWRSIDEAEQENIQGLFESRHVRTIELADEPVDIEELGERHRVTKLPFYPDWKLYEVLAQSPTRLESFLVHAPILGRPTVIPLKGESDVIHERNRRGSLQLGDARQAKSYLRFFTSYVWGEEGAFRLLEPHDPIPEKWQEAISRAGVELEPIKLRRRDNGEYGATAYVNYADALFKTEFHIYPNGFVEMRDDEVVVSELPSPRDVFYRKGARLPGRGAAPAEKNWPLPQPIPGQWREGKIASFANILRKSARRVPRTETAKIDLSGAKIGLLADGGAKHWPHDGVHIVINGTEFGQLSEVREGGTQSSGRTWGERLAESRQMRARDRAPDATPTELITTLQRLLREPQPGWRQRDRKSARRIIEDLEDREKSKSLLSAVGVVQSADARRLRRDAEAMINKTRNYDGASRQMWRLEWLKMQFAQRDRAKRREYNALTFMRIVSHLQSMGQYYQARKVRSFQLGLEADLDFREPRLGGAKDLRWHCTFPVRLITMFVRRLYSIFFDHGQSPARAVASFTACIALGCMGAAYLSYGSKMSVWPGGPSLERLGMQPTPAILVADVQPVETYFEVGAATDANTRSSDRGEWRPACGNDIQPWIYALDVFLPLVNLNQETQCVVAAEHPGWRWAKALFALLGWIVSSLTILTVTGVLRRYVER